MHLTQVTIQGFKSYSELTTIGPFDPGHNVVFGKNGSGKSNFISAIEFVLANEGAGPRPINASVELVFDNSDRRFPIDCDEVRIKRVIGSKKDQFFMNGKLASSRSEVQDTMEAAGSYYIVKRGQISKLACCSKDRLNLVRDVTGVGVHMGQLYKNFAAVFQELVPGGQAELTLLGDQDAAATEQERLEAATGLSAAVSFSRGAEARKNMEQLSRGQKDLVALALIFAIHRCDPAPFYLFDKVDVDLDTDYRRAIASVICQQAAGAQFFTTTFHPELLSRAHRHFWVSKASKASKVLAVGRDEAMQLVESGEVARD